MEGKLFILAAIILKVAVSIPVKSSITDLQQKPNEVKSIKNNERFGVFGGQNITIDKARYVAAVVSDTQEGLVATAVILNDRWILTDAWTLITHPDAQLYVQVGTDVVTETLKDEEKWQFQEQFIHPDFNNSYDKNIALVKLEKPLVFSEKVGNISIASNLPSNGAEGLVTGFGTTNETWGGYLQQLVSTISLYDDCKKHDNTTKMTEFTFCTIQAEKGPCTFDEGAPLVYEDKVIGTFSSTEGICGETPSVYNDMTQLKEWVENTIEKNTDEDEILEEDEDYFDNEQ